MAASILLKSSVDYDNSEQNILPLEDHWIDEEADYCFDYIEKTDHVEIIEPVVETIKDRLFGLGCFWL